jgi:hypothetical protein
MGFWSTLFCCRWEGVRANEKGAFMRLLVCGLVCCVLATGARAQWTSGNWDYAPWNPNLIVVNPVGSMPTPQPVVVILDLSPSAFTFERREAYSPVPQIPYLIAFKNEVISAADQYWVTGNTLYYLTPDHRQKTAPLGAVDRRLSERLNSEQNVAFYLPAEKRKTEARLTFVRHTASPIKRCHCTIEIGGLTRALVSFGGE